MRSIKIIFFSLAVLSAVLAFILSGNKMILFSAERVAETVSQNIQNELSRVDQEASPLLSQSSDKNWSGLSYSFYRIENGKIAQWNQNEFLPDLHDLEDDFSIKLLHIPAGDFLIRKWVTSDHEFLIAVIPLYVTHKISNRYLSPSWNQRIFNITDVVIEDHSVGQSTPVYDASGEILFDIRLLAPQTEIDASRNGILLALTSFSILCALVFFFCWVVEFHSERKYERALLTLIVSLAAMRIVMLLLDFPQVFTNNSLFDPTTFASSVYNPSLGDLLLNAIVVVVIILYIFLFYSRFQFIVSIQQRSENEKLMYCMLFQLAAIFSFLFPFLFIETISNNSSIPLDITQSLSFDLLRSLAYFSLLLGSIAGFAGVHVFLRISISLVEDRTRFFIAYGIAMLIFCIYFISADRKYWITVFTSTGYFLLLILTKLYKDASRVTFRSSFYFFLIALAFSIQTAFSLKHFVEENQHRSQIRFGNNFLVDRDILGEYLLHESSRLIAKDQLIQSRLANPFLGRSIIYDKITQVFLNQYFDRYDVRIHLFGSRGQPLEAGVTEDFAAYIDSLQINADKTEYEGLYFIKNDVLQSTKRYLSVVPVNYHNVIGGFVVLDLSLKRIIPKNVYPELLLDNRFSQYAVSKDFSYAFLTKHGILSSFGNFNYEKDFPVEILGNASLYSSGITINGFNHVGIEDVSGRTAIISAPAYSYFFLFTNVAFFFILCLLLLFVLLSGFGVVGFFKKQQLNYSARIQLYIHLAFLIPLVAVSITTLSLISRSTQEQLTSEFSEKSKLLADRIVTSLDKAQPDSVKQSTSVENQLTDLSKLMNVDATLYDTLGNMMASTQPLIFEDHLMSRMMNRQAWQSIVEDKERSFIGNERIGSLQYSASYIAVKSPASGRLIGIISMPFFDSASSLERSQTIVFANIIDVFFVIFVLFSILSFFAADELTFPLRFITRTLRSTSLIGENKPLTWKANDEIGLMVTEYNRMVENLDKSKIELARSQKESAWREIARQVAHEINNPLTPMKLTLQQMDVNLISGNLTSEKTSQSIKTLLEQVDILNEIASSFSSFARMPAPLLQRIDIISVLSKVTQLHENEQSGKVIFKAESESLNVLGDAQLLNRIFSNIILNALQSRNDEMPIIVEIIVKVKDSNCVIVFKDNGMGISKDLRDKIFLPHFTTKRTGSGIGLAIARQGIEQSGGDIWFESTEREGTTFYVSLPLVK